MATVTDIYNLVVEQTTGEWKMMTVSLFVMILTSATCLSWLSPTTRPSSNILPWISFGFLSNEPKVLSEMKALKAENAHLLRLIQENEQLRAEEARMLAKQFEEERELDVHEYNGKIDALAVEYKEKLQTQKEHYAEKIKAVRKVESEHQSLRRERDVALLAQARAETTRDAYLTISRRSQLETKQAREEMEALEKRLEKECDAEKSALMKHREETKAHKGREATQAKELDAKQKDLDEAATCERKLQDELTRLRVENESTLEQQRRAHDVQVQDLERRLCALQRLYGVQELQRAAVWQRLDRLSNMVGFESNAMDDSATVATFKPEVEALISEHQFGVEALDMRRQVLDLVVPAAELFDYVERLLGFGNTQAVIQGQTSGALPQNLPPAEAVPEVEVEVKATDLKPEPTAESAPLSTATKPTPAPKPAEPQPTPLPESAPTAPAVSTSNPMSARPTKARTSSQSRRPSTASRRHAHDKKAKTQFPWKVEARCQKALENRRAAKRHLLSASEDASPTQESEDEEKPKLSDEAVQGFFDERRKVKQAQASPAGLTALTASPKPETQATTRSRTPKSKPVASPPTPFDTALQQPEKDQAKQAQASSAQAAAPTPAPIVEDTGPDGGRFQAMLNKRRGNKESSASSIQNYSSTPTVDLQSEAAKKRASAPSTQPLPGLQLTIAPTEAADGESGDVAMSGTQQSAPSRVSQTNPQATPTAALPARSTVHAGASQSPRGLNGRIRTPEPMQCVQSQQVPIPQAPTSSRAGASNSLRGLQGSIHAPTATGPPPQQITPQVPASLAPIPALAANGLKFPIHAPELEASQQSWQNSPETTGTIPLTPAPMTKAAQEPASTPASQASSRNEAQGTQSHQGPGHEIQEEEDAWREAEKAKASQANPIASTSAASPRLAPTFTETFRFGPTTHTFNNVQDSSGLGSSASTRQIRQQGGAAGQRRNGYRAGAQLPRLGNRFGTRRDALQSNTPEAPRQRGIQAAAAATQTGSTSGTSQQRHAPMPLAPVSPVIPALTVLQQPQQEGGSGSQRLGQAHADATKGQEDAASVGTERTDLPNTPTQTGMRTTTSRFEAASQPREPIQNKPEAPSASASDENREGNTALDPQFVWNSWRLWQNVSNQHAAELAAVTNAAPTPPPLPAWIEEQQQVPSDATQTTPWDDDLPSPESSPANSRSPADSPQRNGDFAMDDMSSPRPSSSGGFSSLYGGEEAHNLEGSPSGPGGFSPLQPGSEASEDADEEMDDDDEDDDPAADLEDMGKKYGKGDDDDNMDGGNASGSSAPNNADDNNINQSGEAGPASLPAKDTGDSTNARKNQDSDDTMDDAEIDDFEDVEGCRKTNSRTSEDLVDLKDIAVIPNSKNSEIANTTAASTTTSQHNETFIPYIPANIVAMFKGHGEANRVDAGHEDKQHTAAKGAENVGNGQAEGVSQGNSDKEKIEDAVAKYLPQLCGFCQGIHSNHLAGCRTLQQEEEEDQGKEDYDDLVVIVESEDEDEDGDAGADYVEGYCSKCQTLYGKHKPWCEEVQVEEKHQDYQDHGLPTGVCLLCNGIYGQHNPGCLRHPNPRLRPGASQAAVPPPSMKEDGRAEADCTFEPCGAKKGEEHKMGCPQEQKELEAREEKKHANKALSELGFDGAKQRVKQSKAHFEEMKRRGQSTK